jgi:hypothetical protein
MSVVQGPRARADESREAEKAYFLLQRIAQHSEVSHVLISHEDTGWRVSVVDMRVSDEIHHYRSSDIHRQLSTALDSLLAAGF